MSKRLTNKFWYSEHYLPDHKIDASRFDCYDKLGQLEDIEEENGFDLITLFKATQQGIWMKHNDVFYFFDNLIVDFKRKCLVQIVSNDEVETFPFDSYDEEWALSREELEDGKSKEDRK